MRPTMQSMRPRSAGKPAGQHVPWQDNTNLVWLDARGHTRADAADCAGPVVGTGAAARATGPCYERGTTTTPPTLIPQDKIIAASPRTPTDTSYPGTVEHCVPTVMTSQDDVLLWNRTHPDCPLPPFASACPTAGRPPETDRDAILAWNAAHPMCLPMVVPDAKASMAGPLLLGAAVVAAVVIVAVSRSARKNPRRRRRA